MAFGRHDEDELDAELQSHLEMHTADNVRAGMSPEEARRKARVALGGVESAKERYRERRRARWLEELAQDVRFGLRTFVKNPGVAFVAVVSLALAVGATAAIFSIVNGVLLRPMPFGDPDRVVQIPATSMVRDDLESLRRQSHAFDSFAEYAPGVRHLHMPSTVERVTVVVSDRDLFEVLRARPLAGRTFRRDDHLVAVISEPLWRARFAGDPGVIGRQIRLDEQSFTVIAVMPEAFQFPYGAASILRSALTEARVDVWIAEYRPLRDRVGRLVARLTPGATIDSAQSELTTVEIRRQSLDSGAQRMERAQVAPYGDAVLGPARRALWLLFGAVALVLIAACANVANLLLALTSSRMSEIATRAALGASRERLARQFLIESLLLSLAGGLMAVAVGRWTSRLLVAFGAQRIPRVHEVGFDWPAFVFLLLVCVAAAMFFGVAPALAATRVEASGAVKDAGRSTAGHGYGRIRDGLVIGEVALAFVLTSGATLVVGEMQRLRESDSGMAIENVMTFHVGQPMAKGIELQYYDIARRVAEIPGVEAAGFTQVLPLQNWGWSSSSTDFVVKGDPPRAEPPFPIELRYVTPGYFAAIGTPIRSGRGIQDIDRAESPRVILINETLARMHFGGANPVGVEMNRGRIIGVVGDVRQVDLDRSAVPEIYFPIAQNWSQVAELGMTLVVRSAGPGNAIIDLVRSRVNDVNPRIAIFNIRTMEQVVNDSLWDLDLYRWLMGWFAMLTVLLSVVGLYGVVSHSVTARRREWAVRLALGSAPAEVARIVLVRGAVLAAIGIAIGAAALVLALRTLDSELPFIAGSVRGAIVAAVGVSLFAIAIGASWVPALRVARIAPGEALRAQ